MVIISCSGKLHAFALAEQMAKRTMLDGFFTSYAYQKNKMLRSLAKRVDKEEIPVQLIHTNLFLAFSNKLFPPAVHIWNEIFDKWVARRLERINSSVYIGWSGMSLHAMRAAKRKGMATILERGSSHIVCQNEILKEEYGRFGIDFSIHPAVIEKELKEYEEADFISVPSFFVKNSFIAKGIPEQRLFLNPYGASDFFSNPATVNKNGSNDARFTIVYLGTLSIRKGLIYLFEALCQLKLNKDVFEVWFIGKIDEELRATVDKYKQTNWKFFGQINHYELKEYLAHCDVGVQPSLEEGLSMVIPQMMSCGLPVIITPNTGGENIVNDSINGFIIPIREPALIAEKIEFLYRNPLKLNEMKAAAKQTIQSGFTWNDYGERYFNFINHLTN